MDAPAVVAVDTVLEWTLGLPPIFQKNRVIVALFQAADAFRMQTIGVDGGSVGTVQPALRAQLRIRNFTLDSRSVKVSDFQKWILNSEIIVVRENK